MREVDPRKLLSSHTVFRASDVESFHAYIAGMEGRHQRRFAGHGPVEIEVRRAPLGSLELGLVYMSVAMPVEAKRDASTPYYLQFPFSGSIRAEIDGRRYVAGAGAGLVISPWSNVRRESDPGWTFIAVLDGPSVRLRLADLLGHTPKEPLRFAPLITDAAKALRDYGLLVADAIERNLATPRSAVAEVLARGLIDLLLDLQPHSYTEAVRDARAVAKSARIEAVAAYLASHLDEPLRIGTLARVAGCSIRSLQVTFLDHCGCTPLEFVTRQRLARVRGLLESGRRGTTVTQAALAAGFSHPGKLSQRYCRQYGERPSDTLRRAQARGDGRTS